MQLGAVNRTSLSNLLLGEDCTTLLAFEHLHQLSHRTTKTLDVGRFGGDSVLLGIPILLRFTKRNDDGIEIHRLGKSLTGVATPVTIIGEVAQGILHGLLRLRFARGFLVTSTIALAGNLLRLG